MGWTEHAAPVRCGILALVVSPILAGACAGADSINTAPECISSFRLAVSDQSIGLQSPKAGESAWASFQSADEWEGESSVCWVNYTSSDSCRTFVFDIDGIWGPTEWTEVGSQQDPCPPSADGRDFDI